MSAITQMLIFSVFAAIALTLVLFSGEALTNAKKQLSLAELDKARATLEHGFFHAAYCGEGCNITVELDKNITLELSNYTCIITDELNNTQGCYFPFTTTQKKINGSTFMLSVFRTKLEVESIG